MLFGDGTPETYEEFCKIWRGKHSATPSALRKRIIKAVDTIFDQADYYTLEKIRNLLEECALPNDAAFYKIVILSDMEQMTQESIRMISAFSNAYRDRDRKNAQLLKKGG